MVRGTLSTAPRSLSDSVGSGIGSLIGQLGMSIYCPLLVNGGTPAPACLPTGTKGDFCAPSSPMTISVPTVRTYGGDDDDDDRTDRFESFHPMTEETTVECGGWEGGDECAQW